MDKPRIRVLVTAFAAVPGSSPHGAALLAMANAVRAELDLVSVKTEMLSHVERIGDARMFRVPVGEAGPAEQRDMFDRAVARQLEAERYDVVHVTGPFEGAYAAHRKEELGFALIYEMATFPDEGLGIEVERRWAEAHATCARLADLVLVPTEAARRAVSESIGESRVVVISPGVDVGTFDWQPPANGGEPRLLYLGQFTADRDLATVLGAVRRVCNTRPIRMLLAGDTDRGRRERLRGMVEAFDLKGCVEVRGEPPPRALPQIIRGADLCIAPASQSPRFQSLGDVPQPLIEYLACHRPVIAAGVPGVSEVLRDETECLLYPPGDEAALADAILEMLRDRDLRERTTAQGYRRVREHFSSGARRRRVADVYERIAPGSQGADPWVESFEDDGPTEGEMEILSSISGVVMEKTGEVPLPPVPSGLYSDGGATLPPSAEAFDPADTGESSAPKTQPGLSIITESGHRIDTEPGIRSPDTGKRRSHPDTDPGAQS